MKAPDVTGFLLEDALTLLSQWNTETEIQTIETRSPKVHASVTGDEIRVLKQVGDCQRMVLTIATF